MGFVTAALVGGIVLGGMAVTDARKGRKATERAMKKQETEARNLARTPTVLDDTGADIQIGTDGDTSDREGTKAPSSKSTAKTTARTIGGLMGNRGAGGLSSMLGIRR